jgi:hypothetical protein
MSSSPSLSGADRDALYSGILVCRDTVKLLVLFAYDESRDNENLSLMISPLDLLESRLSELALMVDFGVLFNRANTLEENHV